MNDMSPERPLPPELQPRMMQPETPLHATLSAAEWNVVMGALNEMPMKISRPIFDKLLAQLNSPQ